MKITLTTIATKELYTYTASIIEDDKVIFTMTGDAESPEDFKLRYEEQLKEQFPDLIF
jgi:hypothetical protein